MLQAMPEGAVEVGAMVVGELGFDIEIDSCNEVVAQQDVRSLDGPHRSHDR